MEMWDTTAHNILVTKAHNTSVLRNDTLFPL